MLGISENKRIKLHFCQFSPKNPIFLHFKTTFFFYFQFAILKECNTFDSSSVSFIPSCSLQPGNNCFCYTESDIDLQTILHSSMNYWFLCCDLLKDLVKCRRPAEECTINLRDAFHCRHTYIKNLAFFFKKKISVLIDNRNNFEINGLIMLVVSGMFLLPCSAPLMCFSSI